ncbi:glycosyltransferase [Cohnella thailandensis]|uniref:Glycosyltransferase family 2 protein n=1 Tax=Cohnella thailandensis TaxID=557557 RepID=A0A841T7U1_9BACL|nr:glycosyltransferase family A protein [Cohnella thailandensis]MBB6637241.1 glycosyltransferase family 2 protein [Cohnella thailandensis]MBP1976916.1 GT2 family glycosyltransferase [Cohnella thailandensis]
MGAARSSDYGQPGVSVIACTNRFDYLNNLFRNYLRQSHTKKELIIIVNNDRIPLSPYLRAARLLRNVRIYRYPERLSLGACLNRAVRKARFGLVAKFDDDDYYGAYYLADSIDTLARTGADVVGKKSHYMYLKGSKSLLLRFSGAENRPVARLPGATLVFRRQVFDKVRFPDRSVGEDDLFCLSCRKMGFKVYSGNKFNFVAIRRKNSADHTWVISDKELLDHHKLVHNVHNYKKYVHRKPGAGIRP